MVASVALRFEVIDMPDGSFELSPPTRIPLRPRLRSSVCTPALDGAAAPCRRVDETLGDLLDEWMGRPEWANYTTNTQNQYRKSVRDLKKNFGHQLLSSFDAADKYCELRNWQDEQWHRASPCDSSISVLCCALKFAVALRKLEHNVASGFSDIYKVGRRARIRWSRHEIEKFVETADEMEMSNVGDIILLCVLTGFRLQDLITVSFEHVQEWALAKEALKRSRWGNRYFAIIPRTEDLNILLTRLKSRPRKQGVETLLVNEHGDEWAEHQVDIKVRQVRRACGIHYVDPEIGSQEEKHLHDLRGTYATHLITTTDLSDEDIASVMAWSPRWVARIRRVYVDEIVRVNALGMRLHAVSTMPPQE